MSGNPFQLELEAAEACLHHQRKLGRILSFLTLGFFANERRILDAERDYKSVHSDSVRIERLMQEAAELDRQNAETIEIQGIRVSKNAFPDVTTGLRQRYPANWDSLRDMILTRDGFHCSRSDANCRGPLQIHHIRSLSQGGSNSHSNLVTLCLYHHSLNHPHMKEG